MRVDLHFQDQSCCRHALRTQDTGKETPESEMTFDKFKPRVPREDSAPSWCKTMWHALSTDVFGRTTGVGIRPATSFTSFCCFCCCLPSWNFFNTTPDLATACSVNRFRLICRCFRRKIAPRTRPSISWLATVEMISLSSIRRFSTVRITIQKSLRLKHSASRTPASRSHRRQVLPIKLGIISSLLFQ